MDTHTCYTQTAPSENTIRVLATSLESSHHAQ